LRLPGGRNAARNPDDRSPAGAGRAPARKAAADPDEIEAAIARFSAKVRERSERLRSPAIGFLQMAHYRAESRAPRVADVIAATESVLAEIDPTGQGVRPKDLLAALDARGFQYHPEHGTRRAAMFNSAIYNHVTKRGDRSRIVQLQRGRYTGVR
jgi:hypothetical protein